MNIVIIDNDQAILRSLNLLLEAQGHNVSVFPDPRAALFHFLRENRPDVLLVDYFMPEMNGDELLYRLKAELPEDCRIIMMSAHCDLAQKLDLNHLGVSTFLSKPIEIIELERALQTVSDRKATIDRN